MPAIIHLLRRDSEGGASGALNATGIGLIVGIGIIPVFILFWVVAWLFWGYPNNRTCCCTRRKTKDSAALEDEKRRGTEASVDKFYDVPARPNNNFRSESGNSSVGGGPRFAKSDPRLSNGSANDVYVTQEPKRFV